MSEQKKSWCKNNRLPVKLRPLNALTYNQMILRNFIFSLFSLFLSNIFVAQCPTGDMSLKTQAEVDDFASMYPNCDSIFTNVRIGWNNGVLTDITNLDSLYQVEYFDEFFIADTQIEDLSGLDSLKGVKYFILARNDLMVNFDGVDELEYIRTLQVADNATMANLDGLENVDLIESLSFDNHPQLVNLGSLGDVKVNSIIFQNNQALTNLNGLGSVDTLLSIRLINNGMLNDISGLSNLQKINKSIQIKNNSSLSTCSLEALCDHLFESDESIEIVGNSTGCSNVQEVISNCLSPNDFWLSSQEDVDNFKMINGCIEEIGTLIIGNPFSTGNTTSNIQALDSLDCIEQIAKHLVIENNDSIPSLAGLENITSVGKSFRFIRNKRIKNLMPLSLLGNIDGPIKFIENDSLLTTSGLDNITEAKEIFMQDNDQLVDVNGFSNIETILGNFFMEGMENMNLVTGLESLELVEGYLRIEDCFGITSLSSLAELDYIGGDLYLYYIGVTNFDGLDNLDSLGSDFNLEELENLVNMQGLESLQIINGSFEIYYCYYELLSLDGLDNLEYIGDDFYLEENYMLNDISALYNLQFIGGDELYIDESESLSYCAIPAICNFVIDPLKDIHLEDNLTGCNSIEEILTDCESCPACHRIRTNTWLPTAMSSDWNNALNWSLGSVPYECQNVVIPSDENVVVVGTPAKCFKLRMENGATLNGEVDIHIGCFD